MALFFIFFKIYLCVIILPLIMNMTFRNLWIFILYIYMYLWISFMLLIQFGHHVCCLYIDNVLIRLVCEYVHVRIHLCWQYTYIYILRIFFIYKHSWCWYIFIMKFMLFFVIVHIWCDNRMLCGIDVYVGMYVCRYVCLIVAIRHESVEPLILVTMICWWFSQNETFRISLTSMTNWLFNKSTSRCRGKEIF